MESNSWPLPLDTLCIMNLASSPDQPTETISRGHLLFILILISVRNACDVAMDKVACL